MAKRTDTPAPAPTPRSGRMLLWVAAGGVLAAGAVAIALIPRDTPGGKARTVAMEEPPSPDEWMPTSELVLEDEAPEDDGLADPPVPDTPSPAAPPPEPEAGAASSLFDAPAPELISKGYEFASRGQRLRATKVKAIFDYGQEHPDDARPSLILAIDSLNRGWHGFAAKHYLKAYQKDPRVRDEPRMFEDLLSMVGKSRDAAPAADAIVEIFGPEALPEVENGLAEATAQGDRYRAEQLRELKERLSR